MKKILTIFLLMVSCATQADTMAHYVAVTNQLPQMEMKADPKSQSWARSARSILTLTNESIAETLMQANELASTQGSPLFCLPPSISLNSITLKGIILKTYNEISSQQSDKANMTVSQVAALGVMKTYPCQASASNTMPAQLNTALPQSAEHMDALVGSP